MQFNRKGMALMMVLGLMGIGAVLMVTVSTVLATYTRQVRAYQSTDRSIHYAQMGLDEVKWNLMKEYKQWLYESTHSLGSNGPDYDVKVNPANYDDLPLNGGTLDTKNEYVYTAVPTKGFTSLVGTYPRYSNYANTYWVKIIDSVIQSDGKLYDPVTSSANSQIIGRVEGWLRIAEHAPDALQFGHRYDVFCRGTEYIKGKVTYDKIQGKIIKQSGVEERHAHIRASAQAPDSMSISEYVIAVFDGFLNIGAGYNVYGKMHANQYIRFLDYSDDFNSICKIHNVLSTSQEFQFASTKPVANDGGSYINKQSTLNTYVNSTASVKNVTPAAQRTNGFHFGTSTYKSVYALFLGDIARPEIVPRITPKTADHFANVKAAARVNGMYLENGDARWVRFEPGDLTKNGDGKVYIKTMSGNLWVNGKKVLTGAGEYTIFLNQQSGSEAYLLTPIIYIDGNPSTATFSSAACTYTSSTKFDITKGIYNTKGIRGLSGVIDGQVSIYSGYDIVITGDITYQEFAKIIKFSYKDMNDSGKIKQPYLSGATPVKPDPNAPNLIGVNAMHDIILPGDLFANGSGSYDGKLADRCDPQGNGILTGTGGSADTLADIFSFGVFFAGHRAYGEVPSGSSAQTYNRNQDYITQKGTWYIYGSLVSFQQVYAVSSGTWYGFRHRSYNYDPNLYTFKPPMTMQISTLPVWSWRLTSGFPEGLALK